MRDFATFKHRAEPRNCIYLRLIMVNTGKLDIPDGVYGGKLNAELWKLLYNESLGKGLMHLLLEVVKVDLLMIDETTLKKQFPNTVLQLLAINITDLTGNKELLARCLEVQVLLDRSRISQTLKNVSELYDQLFDETNNYVFLVRRIALIRLAKGIFTNELPEIFEKLETIVPAIPYPYWQLRVIDQMPAVFSPVACQELLQVGLELQVKRLADNGDFNGARLCLNSLCAIGSLTTSASLIEQALLFELEGDKIISEKKPNTYYPTISQKFSEGFKLIKTVADCQAIKDRLMAKLQKAQLEDAQMMAAVGLDMSPNIDFKKLQKNIADLNLSSFVAAIQALLEIPILPVDLIKGAAAEQEANQSPLGKLFTDQVRLSAKGKPVGFSEGEQAKANQIRMQHREVMIVFIKMIKDVMDLYDMPIKEAVFEMLAEIKSPLVSNTRIYPYTEGLFQGFQNNYVISAHLLVPQLENSLRELATQNHISVTNYEKREEFENTLGGTLDKTGHLIKEELLVELRSFFTDSTSVNFRNELLHGLMSTDLIQHYGIYNWWLMLKMIFQTKRYFELPNQILHS